MNSRRLNWLLVVLPIIFAAAFSGVASYWAVILDEDQAHIPLALAAFVSFDLLMAALIAFGIWRIYKEYTRSKKLW